MQEHILRGGNVRFRIFSPPYYYPHMSTYILLLKKNKGHKYKEMINKHLHQKKFTSIIKSDKIKGQRPSYNSKTIHNWGKRF